MELYVRTGFIFLFAVFDGHCHGKNCHHDTLAMSYYCETDCYDDTRTAGGVMGGVLAVAIVIGITVCVSVHLKVKHRRHSTQQNNGAPQQRPNTLHALHATNSSIVTPPAFMYEEPTGTRQTVTQGHM